MPGIFPVVGDLLQQRAVCSTVTQVGMNITGWYVSAIATGGATVNEIALAEDALYAPLYKAVLGNAATYRGVGYTNVVPPRTIEYVGNANAGAGTAGVTLAPTQTRGLITFQGVSAGPRNRGRIYIPFPASVFLNPDGSPTTGYITLLGNLRNAYAASHTIVGAGGTTTIIPAILHRPYAVGNYTTVFATYVRTKWGTQRRSGMYGRPNIPPF